MNTTSNRLYHTALIFLLLTSVVACNSVTEPTTSTETEQPTYFSLNTYFSDEIDRLTKEQPDLEKTVNINGSSESKATNTVNWKHELELFAQADINKAAWTNSYTVDSTERKVVYTSKEPDLKTKQIIIQHKADKTVLGIEIHNEESNWIYRSVEKLTYYPDSLYSIDKIQEVRIVGSNHYHVQGVWRSPTP